MGEVHGQRHDVALPLQHVHREVVQVTRRHLDLAPTDIDVRSHDGARVADVEHPNETIDLRSLPEPGLRVASRQACRLEGPVGAAVRVAVVGEATVVGAAWEGITSVGRSAGLFHLVQPVRLLGDDPRRVLVALMVEAATRGGNQGRAHVDMVDVEPE